MFVHHARPYVCTVAALSLAAFHVGARADSDGDRKRDRSKDRTVTVDCASGDTIARALTKLAAAAPGATVIGPDATLDVIRVTGSRVTIDGLTVTGGRNGITADGAAGLIVQNSTVQGTGRTGIVIGRGASAIVDN